jgi:hypothetical protein
MDFRLKTFAAEATSRLEFLVSEYGFAEPEITGDDPNRAPQVMVRYTRSDAEVETSIVLWYMGEEYVTTLLCRKDVADADGRITVGTNTAHKGHEMRKALDRQTAALRDLLKKLYPAR